MAVGFVIYFKARAFKAKAKAKTSRQRPRINMPDSEVHVLQQND